MFMRLLILEQDRNSRWIKIVGALLITLRFADWPYELAFHTIQEQLMGQAPQSGSQCWAQWYNSTLTIYHFSHTNTTTGVQVSLF